MRNLSTAVQATIANYLGLEPVNILEIQWNREGGWSKYADKDIEDYEFFVDGRILEISTLESVIKLDNQSQSQGISVKLSDTDGVLKNIFNTIDLHGKQCKLYQWFEKLPLSERFKLYEGEITSPIEWSEGDRTLSFEVITQLADKEVGFSPEEGYFDYLPNDAYGNPWPLAFGTVQNVPAARLNEVPNSLMAEPLGVTDPTLMERKLELRQKYAELQAVWYFYVYASAQAAFTCAYGDTPEQRQNGCSAQQTLESALAQIAQQMSAVLDEEAEVEDLIAEQNSYQKTTLEILNGGVFPQGKAITLQAGSVRLQGSFSGNLFTISDINLLDYQGYSGSPFGFTWVQEGTTITIQSDLPIIYIVSLLPCEVLYVSAYKQVENGKTLVAVPMDWYEVKTIDLGGYTVTYLTFSKPISSFDETYSDDVYVTLTSTVGPNTVDIIEWLITKYTDMSIDATSFTHVKSKLENYPSHFVLLERKNILVVLEEIAFQARCAIWISDRTFYLRYLSEEQTATSTISETEVDAGSLVIKSTTTEELVTKLVAKWHDDYAVENPMQIILRHNVNKYGIREREIDFYIYNIFELVLKSATFWLIRKSNIWKNLIFTVYLDSLAIETFDIVEFDFNEEFVASSAIKGMITASIYDSDSKTIAMEAWLPVKCGSMERYNFAEPHDISIELLFPTQEEIDDGSAGGDGPGTEVEGGIEFSETTYTTERSFWERIADGERVQGRDYGEMRPSDLDDVKPEPNFISRPVTYLPEPAYQYIYPDYSLNLYPPDEEREWSFAFPGQVTGKIAASLYNVAVYKFGLGAEPSIVQVKQLQLAEGEEIPTGTWVIVTYNRWATTVDGNEVISDEYTMQVPIWL